MHDGAETQEIVEAFAEHDFLSLSEMVRASSCEDVVFCIYCQCTKKENVTPKFPIR